jgi:hypothetical protein
MKVNKLTDDSIMPWGKHQAKRLGDISKEYFLFLYFECKLKDKDIKKYIEEKFDVSKEKKKKKKSDK